MDLLYFLGSAFVWLLQSLVNLIGFLISFGTELVLFIIYLLPETGPGLPGLSLAASGIDFTWTAYVVPFDEVGNLLVFIFTVEMLLGGAALMFKAWSAIKW